MKKTILLSALVASVASMAATTGSVEAYNKNKTVYTKGASFVEGFKASETQFGVKTEVKVTGSGLSFGADLKTSENFALFSNATTGATVLENVKLNSSVWAKYELPELAGVMTYFKGTYETVGKITVEADASYKVLEDVKAGLNSETTFDVSAATTGTTVTSTHKVYAKGNYSVVKDIEAELGFTHDYDTAATAVKEVFLNAKASYDVMSDLKLTGKVDFAHALNGGSVSEDSLLTGKLAETYRHSYLLSAVYTGVKDTEVKLDAFIEHNLQTTSNKALLNFGFKPEIKYTGIENLVLSSKNVLGGTATYTFPSTVKTTGYVKLNANGEYTYKATDKLTVKPSLDLTATFSEIDGPAATFKAKLAITPKVAVEYKPVESLTLSGDVAAAINFGGTQAAFDYTDTTVKSNFNVKYTW